jgi:hypothetical protein
MSIYPVDPIQLPPEIVINPPWALPPTVMLTEIPRDFEIPPCPEIDLPDIHVVIPPVNINLPPIRSHCPWGPCQDTPLHRPRFEVDDVRFRIVNLVSGSSWFPKYIGCPPLEEVESVRHQVLSEMAHTFWLAEDRPEGRAEVHWEWAIEDWDRAMPSCERPWM